MQAFEVEDLAHGAPLSLAEVAAPKPSPGQVLIKVHAAGVTPTELLWYPTTHRENGEPRLHAIPGHEFSGSIAAMGEGASGFAPGDEVYGMNDWYDEGATAEYCVTVPSSIARKPRSLTHVEAASVPISALTAWQGLFDQAKIQPGERVLVQGGAGGVGLFVVQLAHRHGAYVIATASHEGMSLVRSLGAAEVIDYRASRFEEGLALVDVVFDTVGGMIRKRSAAVLKPNGRMVSVAAEGETSTDPQATKPDFIVEPNQAQLAEVARMIDEGELRTFVKGVVPFKDAALAYTGAVPAESAAGKFVVAVISA